MIPVAGGGDPAFWVLSTGGGSLPPGPRLSSEELSHAKRVPAGRPREGFLAGRILLRRILEEELGVPHDEAGLRRDARGKPLPIRLRDGRTLRVSASDSQGFVALGASFQTELGVDVQVARPLSGRERLGERLFAQGEIGPLRSAEPGDAEAVFYGLWTAKEAVAKISGGGLFLAPKVLPEGWRGAPPLPDRPPLRSRTLEGWECLTFSPLRGVIASVATVAPLRRLGVVVRVGGGEARYDLASG